MAEYKYVGDGAGVPGLPHLISDQEAEQLGVSALLAEAIANGSYTPLSAPQTSPQTKTTFGGKELKKKESE